VGVLWGYGVRQESIQAEGQRLLDHPSDLATLRPTP
jgi:phosphoglycolate phosphatase-like HAD superfamily hydrolase